MNFDTLLRQRMVKSMYGEALTPEELKQISIAQGAVFNGTLRLGRVVSMGIVTVGDECAIDDRAGLENGVHLGSRVTIGRSVELGETITVMNDSRIGEGAILNAGVIVGPGVKIPAEAQVGSDIVIPSTKTIMALGRLGTSERMMTVHGSDDGPLYSAGCQFSDDWQTIEERIKLNTGTSQESAAHYRRYLDVLRDVGDVVQHYYDAQAEQVAELRHQVAVLRG